MKDQKSEVETLKAEIQRQKAWVAALGIIVLLLMAIIVGLLLFWRMAAAS